MKELSNEEDKELSVLKDPFTKQCVKAIHCHVYNNEDSDVSVRGSVEFKNGETEGTQKFKTNDFSILIKQIDDFIKSLD